MSLLIRVVRFWLLEMILLEVKKREGEIIMEKDEIKVITIGEINLDELSDAQLDGLCKAILDAFLKSKEEEK